MLKHLVTSSLILIAASGVPGVAIAGDVAAGEKVFKKCQVCHEVGPGAKNRVGPVLNGLDGRRSGTIEGFRYSAANKKAEIVWNEDTFKEYIRSPRARIPGTTMVFIGLKNEKEIEDLWAYLKQFDPEGKTP